jgi:hypothetical protein
MAKTLFRRWVILDEAQFGEGQLYSVAWRTKSGPLAFAGIVQVPNDLGFPKMIFGGTPASFKQAKEFFRTLRHLPRLTQLQISWDIQPFNTAEDLKAQIEAAEAHAIERWHSTE